MGASADREVRNAGLSVNKKSLVAVLFSKLDCQPTPVCSEACYANHMGADWPTMIKGCEISSLLKLKSPRLVEDMIRAINTGEGLETAFLNRLQATIAEPVGQLRPITLGEFNGARKTRKLQLLRAHGFFPLPWVKLADTGDLASMQQDVVGTARQVVNLLRIVSGCANTCFWHYTRKLEWAARLQLFPKNMRVILSLDACTAVPSVPEYSGAMSYLYSPRHLDPRLPDLLYDDRLVVVFSCDNGPLPEWVLNDEQLKPKVCPAPSGCRVHGPFPPCCQAGCLRRCRLPVGVPASKSQ